jgi:hypothetical protein
LQNAFHKLCSAEGGESKAAETEIREWKGSKESMDLCTKQKTEIKVKILVRGREDKGQRVERSQEAMDPCTKQRTNRNRDLRKPWIIVRRREQKRRIEDGMI